MLEKKRILLLVLSIFLTACGNEEEDSPAESPWYSLTISKTAQIEPMSMDKMTGCNDWDGANSEAGVDRNMTNVNSGNCESVRINENRNTNTLLTYTINGVAYEVEIFQSK